MYQKVRAYVKEHHMLSKQDKVIVGVSGGADSICLLFMLIELQKEIDFSMAAVHVHHGLRGESADADEKYVEEMCKKLGVKFYSFHENVKEYAKETGTTEEEAGRNVRRNVFQKVLKEEQGTKIALAHHKNDNVETFLWNLCRGTGLKGLGGILPVVGEYIRPLLCLKREEIELYLQERKIYYCTDETNLENDYTRNRIRNQMIPYMEETLNVQTVNHIADTIENIRLFNEYINKEVEKYVRSCVFETENKYILNQKMFEGIPEVFYNNVIHETLAKVAGKKKDIEACHIRSVKELFHKQVGKSVDLPYGLIAARVYDGIEIFDKAEEICGSELINEVEPEMEIRVFDRTSDMVTFPQNLYTKWFDYDIIKRAVKIRHREAGDYIVIDKQGKTQKLKQYFINEKIPQDLRERSGFSRTGIHARRLAQLPMRENTRRVCSRLREMVLFGRMGQRGVICIEESERRGRFLLPGISSVKARERDSIQHKSRRARRPHHRRERRE